MKPCIAVAWLAVLGCAGAQPRREAQTAAAPPPAGACVADGLGPLKPAQNLDKPACGSGAACGDACLVGDAAACYFRGTELQEQNAAPDAADAMYLRACQAGLPIGCTNYAAGLWARQDAQSSCARRLFEKSCAADEAFGCGMLGRMLVDQGKELARGREILERSCQKLGRFPCRVFALELENGSLGTTASPAAIQKLLALACKTGDPDACGPPPSAESTFHSPP